MKAKRILSAILCIAMVLSTMSFNVFADGTVCDVVEMDGTCYATFDDAWKTAVEAGGTKTIKLHADATHDNSDFGWTQQTVDLTIDLNGHNLTLNKSLPVAGNGYGGNKLAINDTANTGSIIFNNNTCIVLENDYADTLVINGGKFVKEDGNKAIICDDAWGTVSQTVKINGGDFTGVSSAILNEKINENDTVTKAENLVIKAPEGCKWENGTTLVEYILPCAKIGDVEYTSFDEAISDLKDNDTLTIVGNAPKGIIIARDLKNVTITAEDGVTVNGILFDTKKDAPGTGRTFENITVTDIDFVNQGVNFNCGDTPWVKVYGFTMTECSFKGEKKAADTGNRLFDIGIDSPGSNQFHDIVIKDCTVDGCTQGIRLGALYGNCEISNNKINNAYHNSITLRSIVTADVNVTGNNITNGGDRAFRIGSQDSSAKVRFTNNTIDGETGDPNDGSNFKTNAGTDIPVPVFEGNTVGGKEWTPCVAQIGETKYLALKDAFAAAKSGDTITLLSDVNLNGWTSPVMDNMSFTIDGNNKVITGLTAPLIMSAATGSATVTIKDLTIKDSNITGQYTSHSGQNTAAAIIAAAGYHDVTLQNCHVENSTIGSASDYYSAGLIGYWCGQGTLTIDGCSVDNCKISAISSVGGMLGHEYGGAVINNSSVGANEITSTDDGVRADKAGAVIGRNNGGETKISVTETAESTIVPEGTAEGRIVGSIVGGAVEITGGSYFADPTLTEKDTKPTVSEGYRIEQKDSGMYGLGVSGSITQGCMSTVTATRVRLEGEMTAGYTGETLEIRLYSGNKHIATSTLQNQEYIGKYNITLSWNFVISGDESTSWKTEWIGGNPSDSYKPTSVELWVDGEKIAQAGVTMYASNDYMGPDAVPYVWDELTGVATRKYIVEVNKAEVVAGEEVEVSVYLDGVDLYGAKWELKCDEETNKLFNNSEAKFNGYSSNKLIKNDEPLATYTFTARPQSKNETYTFTLVDGAIAQTRGESVQSIEPTPYVDTTNATVTIKLDTFGEVKAEVDDKEVQNNAADVVYNGEAHSVKIITDPNEVDKITVTVNGEAQALDTENKFSITKAGTYEITYIVEKLGYAAKTESFTLTVKDPEYFVEAVRNYAAGNEGFKTIVLVYTKSDAVSFTYAGETMFDVSYKNDKYTFNNKSFDKVYAIVVDGIEGAEDGEYTKNVKIAYNKIANEYIIGEPDPEYDLTGEGQITLSDVTTAFGVYDVFPDYYNDYMEVVLKADVNGDKCVSGADTSGYAQAFEEN